MNSASESIHYGYHLLSVAKFIDPWHGDNVNSGVDFIPQSGIYELGYSLKVGQAWYIRRQVFLHNLTLYGELTQEMDKKLNVDDFARNFFAIILDRLGFRKKLSDEYRLHGPL